MFQLFTQSSIHLLSNSTSPWVGAGDVERTPIWAFYLLLSLSALYLNTNLMFNLFRMPNRTSTDVLIGGGLCGGIIVSCMGCIPFCLGSLVSGTFAGGRISCILESFGHIIGMTASFLSIAAIAHRTYLAVVKNEPYRKKQAYWALFIIYIISTFGTILTGIFSPTYLVMSGTFCFFAWSSPALTVFAWPIALIAAMCMAYWYYESFKYVKAIQNDAMQYMKAGNHSGHITQSLAKRLSFLVLLFVCCYAAMISLSFYELSGRRAASYYDILAALTLLLYWVSAPIAYACINKRLGLKTALCFVFCEAEPWAHESSGGSTRNKARSATGDTAKSPRTPRSMSNDAVELANKPVVSIVSERSTVDLGVHEFGRDAYDSSRAEDPRQVSQGQEKEPDSIMSPSETKTLDYPTLKKEDEQAMSESQSGHHAIAEEGEQMYVM